MPRPASGGARRVGPPQLRQNCCQLAGHRERGKATMTEIRREYARALLLEMVPEAAEHMAEL